ncbi:ribonuclease H-like domain-containing protein [Tanacetum coccineum]
MDLYPVTAPSLIHHAFLVNQHTWHQSLGHPQSEVLHHLVYQNFISYNKDKPPALCHACQLGKHMRLSFASSDTVGNDTAYLLLYVDDIVLTASSEILLQQIIKSLHQAFDMTDLGPLNYFLGIYVTRDSLGLFLSQKKYVVEILDRAHMVNCNPNRTPIDTESKMGSDGDSVFDPTLYWSLAGSLQYLTFTRPDISYAVQQLFSSSTTNLVAYSDADWAGCPTTRRLTSGYCVFLGNNLLSWSSKRQPMLSRSRAEAEYRGVANVVAETCCQVHVLYVPSRYQFADIFTKGLPSTLFEEFRSSLSVRCPPALTAGEC